MLNGRWLANPRFYIAKMTGSIPVLSTKYMNEKKLQIIQEMTKDARSCDNVTLINIISNHPEFLAVDLESDFGILLDILIERFIETDGFIESSGEEDTLVQETFPEYINEH